MLITAAVLVRSQKATPASDYGFNSNHVLVGNINFIGTGYSPAKAIDFYEDLIDRLESTPGILSASVVDNVPIVNGLAGVAQFGGRAGRVRVRSDNADTEYDAYSNRITRGHFKTLMIPILQGRDFSRQDRGTSSRVGIINEALAGQLWPAESAIGRHVRLDDGSSIEVVGVVKTSKYRDLEEKPQFALYVPVAQQPLPLTNTFIVKTASEPLSQTNLVRSRASEIDPTLLLHNFDTLDNRINFWMIIFRILSYITGVPGTIAFVLGIIGTYGTMAFFVAQRRREIGVRIALGAHPSEALLLILRQGMKWTGAGVGLGICGAFLATFWLSRYLERVTWFDPAAFIATSVLMAIVAAVACYIPARRASRVDPMMVLRDE
jgi:predicted permease